MAKKRNASSELNGQRNCQVDIFSLIVVRKYVISNAFKRVKALGHEGVHPRREMNRSFNTSRSWQITKKWVQWYLKVFFGKVVCETCIIGLFSSRSGEAGAQSQALQDPKSSAPNELNKCVWLQRFCEQICLAGGQQWERRPHRWEFCSLWNKHTTPKTTGAGPQRRTIPWTLSKPPESAVNHGVGHNLRKRQDTLGFRETGVQKRQRHVSTQHARGNGTSLDRAALWRCEMDVPAGLHSGL